MGVAQHEEGQHAGVSPQVLALRAQLTAGTMRPVATFSLGDIEGDVRQSTDSLWAILRQPGKGGLALRLAYSPGGFETVRSQRAHADEALRLSVDSAMGRHVVMLQTDGLDLHRLRAKVDLTPAAPLLVPFLPRDVYPLDAHDDPAGATGTV